MADGRKVLSDISGLSTGEIDDIWRSVKANRAKLKSCKRHGFTGGKITNLGDKYRCLHCGGTESLSNVAAYIEGYEAAGGNADDIWPGWQ